MVGIRPTRSFWDVSRKQKTAPLPTEKRPCPDIGIGYKSNGHKENPANTIRPLPIKSFSRHYHRRRLPALCEGQDLLLVRRKRFFYFSPETGLSQESCPSFLQLSMIFPFFSDFSKNLPIP